MKRILLLLPLTLLLTACKNLPRIFDVLDGPGMVYTPPTNVSLEEVQRQWSDVIIPVDVAEGEDINVITLLRAFNLKYPTHAIDTLLAKVNEPDFEGSYTPDDGTGDIIQTLYARPYPFVQFYTEKEGKEHMNACTIQRENGHTLLIIELIKNVQKSEGDLDFYCFFDYDPETSNLTPEATPWENANPVVKGNHLVPSLDLFDGVFTMGEYTSDDEGPIYCHFLEFDGQNIVYAGYEANLPEDEEFME